MTTEQYYEQLKQSSVNIGDILYRDIDIYKNGLYLCVHTETKGKKEHIKVLKGLFGSQGSYKNGVFNYKYALKWSLPYFRTFDPSHESKGFVWSSLFKGLSISEHFFAAINARKDLVTKFIMTAKYGDKGRQVRQFLETYVVNNNRFVAKTIASNQMK